MKRIIVTAKQYAGKTGRAKVTAAKATSVALNVAGGYFPDGGPTATALMSAANALETALNNYDINSSDTNRDLVEDAELACDIEMNDAVLYVQGKCNAVNDLETAAAIAHAAALDVKKKAAKKPIPEILEEVDAAFSGIPQTILLKIKKKSKFAIWFEVWISLTPTDESSWELKDTLGGKQLLVQGLSTGQKYYMRIVACNNTGKAEPSDILSQIAA